MTVFPNRAPDAGFWNMLQNHCTNSGHPLVDELHSIDFKEDKIASFYLTLNFKGVKTTSFFDNF